MADGWIKIQRTICEHWIWEDANKLKWWLDLLLMANYSTTKVNIGLLLFDCNRGEVITTLSKLATRWGVTKDRVRNFLLLLEKDGIITYDSLTKATRITICKYDIYQANENANQTLTKRSPNADQTLTKRSIYIKENKKERIEEYKQESGSNDQLSSASYEAQAVQPEKPKTEKLPFKEIKEMWNETCPVYPKLFTISEARKNKMRLRIAEMGGSGKALPLIKQIFEKMQQSNFLKGDNRRGWKASFDWLFENDKNWVKVYEGNYDNKPEQPTATRYGNNRNCNDEWK